jgi:hypothetical protein
MMGPSHRLLGGLVGASFAAMTGQSFTRVVLAGIVASATSSGDTSPDLDQSETWRACTRLLPASWRRHRGLTHWWALPVAAWFLVPDGDPTVAWVIQALILGWGSHILGDAVFGKVPLVPGGPYIGLDIADTGGFIETGQTEVRGRKVTVLPFGPVRAGMAAALAVVLATSAGLDVGGAADRVQEVAQTNRVF